jgi:hypothetical protein
MKRPDRAGGIVALEGNQPGLDGASLDRPPVGTSPGSGPFGLAGGGSFTFARRIWLSWLAVRMIGILALGDIFPYNRTTPSNADVTLYWRWSFALWHGAIPYHTHLAHPIVYPPGVLPVLGLPPFSLVDYRLEFLFAAMVVDALVLRALLVNERRIGSVVWVFASLLLGPIFWSRLDIFVAAMLVAAVLAFEKRRFGWASFWLAWAGLLKIWPLLLLVLLFRLVPPKRRSAFAGVGAATVVISVVPFLALGGAHGLWYVVQQQAGRGVELESLFAVPLYVLSAVGHHVTVVSATASWGFIGTADSALAAMSTALFIGAVIFLLWRGLVRPVTEWDAATWLLLVVVLVLLTDRVLSPQYLVWGAAAVALFVDRCRWPRPLLVTTALLLVATQLQFPFGFNQLTHTTDLALPLSAVHGVILVAFGIVTLRNIHTRADFGNPGYVPEIR